MVVVPDEVISANRKDFSYGKWCCCVFVAVAIIDAGKKFCQSLPRNIYMEVSSLPWPVRFRTIILKFSSHSYFFVQKFPTAVGLFQSGSREQSGALGESTILQSQANKKTL